MVVLSLRISGYPGGCKMSINKEYLDSECIRIRQLVEQVHDKSFVIDNSYCIHRTEEGQILARVLFGLDSLRGVINKLDISTNKWEAHI